MHQVQVGEWMKYTSYTKRIWIGHFVLLFFAVDIEPSKVEHSASYVGGCWWLLLAVFVSAAGTAYVTAFEGGGTRSEQPPSRRKYSFEVFVQKERDSKPSVHKKPDIGRDLPLNQQSRLRGSLLIGVSDWRACTAVHCPSVIAVEIANFSFRTRQQ